MHFFVDDSGPSLKSLAAIHLVDFPCGRALVLQLNMLTSTVCRCVCGQTQQFCSANSSLALFITKPSTCFIRIHSSSPSQRRPGKNMLSMHNRMQSIMPCVLLAFRAHVEPQREDEWELFNISAHCERAALEAELKDAECVMMNCEGRPCAVLLIER